MQNLDLGKLQQEALREAEEESSREYRDPYESPYGDPNKQTETQAKFWKSLQDHGTQRFAMVGGKGAGKSFSLGTFCLHWAQVHPKSQGCIVANSSRQAKDAAGEAIVEVAENLGYNAEYYRSKKIKGQQKSRFYAIDLDGEGTDKGLIHMILVRSLESAKSMEGSELDYLAIDEIQDAEKGDVQVALTRNRGSEIAGPNEKNPLFIAGMTASELHWMYGLMEDGLGLKIEEEFEPNEDDGVLYEPTIFENKVNLGQSTIDSYREMMDTRTAEQHIYAKRTSSKDNLVLHEYRDSLHRNGRMSELSAYYDPYADLYIMIDFNVNPMTCTLWQEKPWTDDWLDKEITIEYRSGGTVKSVKEFEYSMEEIDHPEAEKNFVAEYDSLEEYSAPNTEILAQVDEYEVWPDDQLGGGTEGLMRHVVQDYEDHAGDVIINGDATGHRRDTRSSTSDWGIVRKHAQKIGATVVPGLMVNSDMKKGTVKYDNPPLQDSINLLNRTLMNGNGEARMCFLPESEYESGGAAASCASIERRPDGSINDSPDRREGKEVRRTHYFDTCRYAVWFWQDGASPSEEEFNQMMDEIEQDLGGNSVGGSYFEEDGGNTQWF